VCCSKAHIGTAEKALFVSFWMHEWVNEWMNGRLKKSLLRKKFEKWRKLSFSFHLQTLPKIISHLYKAVNVAKQQHFLLIWQQRIERNNILDWLTSSEKPTKIMKGWFDAFRDDGAPTLYSFSNRTPVIGDVSIIVVSILFATFYTAFLVIFPGVRKQVRCNIEINAELDFIPSFLPLRAFKL
jgi:hypothetical protein